MTDSSAPVSTHGATHYATLGVRPNARPAAIEKAWRRQTAKEGPGSARLTELNAAAETLLDPVRRAAYDAELAAAAKRTAETDSVPDSVSGTGPDGELESDRPGSASKWTGSKWTQLVALVLLPILALGAAAVAVVFTMQSNQRTDADRSALQAQSVAEKSLESVLAYDYRKLDEDRRRAVGLLTPRLGKEFDKSFDLLAKAKDGGPGAALQTKTVVTAKTVATAVMDAKPEEVTVLAFVNQTSTHGDEAPRSFANRVRVVLVKHGDEWLIDELDPR